ncbi:hypothetical protein [Sorangium sp. So ce341]|uniref:hypothetical protein n=1 Tax=Sorangium sp. So ce341 TaxID=3133302 RepID=UPI003F5FA7BF
MPPELARLVRCMLSVARDARPSDLGEVHGVLAALAQRAAAPSAGAPEPPAPAPPGPPVRVPDGEAVEGDEVDPMAPTERPNTPPPPAEPRSTGRRTAARAAAWTTGLAVALAGIVAVVLAWRGGPAPVEVRPPPRASNPRALSRYAAALEAVGDANEGECDMLDWPVTYVRSFWFLGQALEQTGDIAGACHAYASVIERWGGASPPSQTAARARGRSRALGCGPIG